MPDRFQKLIVLGSITGHMKTLRILAILLLLLNGTGAIFGGWSLIRDPMGSDYLSCQMPDSQMPDA